MAAEDECNKHGLLYIRNPATECAKYVLNKTNPCSDLRTGKLAWDGVFDTVDLARPSGSHIGDIVSSQSAFEQSQNPDKDVTVCRLKTQQVPLNVSPTPEAVLRPCQAFLSKNIISGSTSCHKITHFTSDSLPVCQNAQSAAGEPGLEIQPKKAAFQSPKRLDSKARKAPSASSTSKSQTDISVATSQPLVWEVDVADLRPSQKRRPKSASKG